MVLYIILTLLVISFLALIHELGHYLCARYFNVSIKEFAVGMGPKIFSRKSYKTGIAYSIRLLPIGGFVAMVGEDEESDDDNALNKKPVWQRIVITAAGAIVNLLFGFILMGIIVTASPEIYGTTIDVYPYTVMTSAESGLREGDKIIKVNNTAVYTESDLSYEINMSGGVPLDITVIRSGSKITIKNVEFPTHNTQGITVSLLDFALKTESKNPISIIKHTFFGTVTHVRSVWDSLIGLVSGKYGIEMASGPIGITTAVKETAEYGISSLLNLIVLISVNLGIFNLLPLPALDGGRLVFQFIELIRRKPVKPEIEGYIHGAGIMLLMLLMVVVTFNDILKFF